MNRKYMILMAKLREKQKNPTIWYQFWDFDFSDIFQTKNR